MGAMRCALALIAALALPAAAHAEGAGTSSTAATYRVDPEGTRLMVLVRPRPSALFASLSHEHVVRASRVAGTVRWDPAHPEACGVALSIPVEGLVVDEPAMRKAVRLDGELDEGDRATVTKHMRAEGQLDLARHPKITFEATGCRVTAAPGDGPIKLVVQGRLTVRGHAANVAAPVTVRFSGAALEVEGELSLTHAELGMSPYSAGLGTIANDELLRFRISVRATRPPPGG